MIRVIDKQRVDDIIRLTRKYAKTGDVDLLGTKHNLARQASVALFGDSDKWLAICDLISSIIGLNGLCHSASNSLVYSVFELVGIVVKDSETRVEDFGQPLEADKEDSK